MNFKVWIVVACVLGENFGQVTPLDFRVRSSQSPLENVGVYFIVHHENCKHIQNEVLPENHSLVVLGVTIFTVKQCLMLTPNAPERKRSSKVLLRRLSGFLNDSETTEPEDGKSSEFPPSIFTTEQLQQGAAILYFVGALYSFAIIGIVCGDYFLPSVDCICTDLNLSQDVAAATFMSFATTAPELFIILIATFITKSDIGVGAVVGSGMFNILGVATIGGLAARTPIKLDWWPLYRDSLVYMFAPLGLAVVLSDGEVTLFESICLIIYYFLYFVIMFFNRSIRNHIKCLVKKLNNKQIKKGDKAVEKPPPVVPNISLTLDLSKNNEIFNVQDGNDVEEDNRSFKAYFMNYDDSISLRRISTCSNSSSRSNRSRRKSDRSLNFKSSQVAGVSGNKLGDELNLSPQKLPEAPKDSFNGKVEDIQIVQPQKAEDSISVHFCTLPEGNIWNKFTWIALWVPFFVLYHTIPDCRSNRWRRFYPLTFLMCVFWIGVSSYFGTWMISAVGETIGIPESVMGLTFLALGGSMPEAISTFIMSRQGEGGLGFSNSLGGNTMDICLCLGVPWLIKTAMEGPIPIESEGLQYNSISLILGIVVLLSISTYTKFHMNKTMGLVCFVFYFIFIIISLLIEMNIIEVNSNR